MSADHPERPGMPVNLFSPESARCPQPDYARLRSECPVARQPITGGTILSRYEDVIWALRHPEIFSSEMEAQMKLGTERPMIPQQVDPPAQTRYRKILDVRFSKKRVDVLEPMVRDKANELIDGIIASGECEFNRAFAVPLPCTAFLGIMGLPLDRLDYFLGLKDAIIRPQDSMETLDLAEAERVRARAGKEIYAYFEGVIDERKAHPSTDMMGYLLEAEIDGQKLSRNEILDICYLMLLGGLDTVTATLGCNMAYLAENPAQRKRIVDDPATLDRAVEELLRWETPVTAVPRVLKQDVTVGGYSLKKGEMVGLLLGAANTDGEEFPGAEQVDFDRARNRHIAFGAGPHRCLGSHLARMELRVAMDAWHRRIPEYRIKPGETPRYSPGIREVQYLPLVWGDVS